MSHNDFPDLLKLITRPSITRNVPQFSNREHRNALCALRGAVPLTAIV
jgi:hypothetical protein